MSRLVIDTSAYAAFKMDLPEALTALRQARELIVPAVVVGELLGGFARGRKERENRDGLTAFLKASRTRIATIGAETAERYARIYAYLRGEGRPIPTNDLWIAACAMESGAELLTADRHFEQVPQVIVRLLGM